MLITLRKVEVKWTSFYNTPQPNTSKQSEKTHQKNLLYNDEWILQYLCVYRKTSRVKLSYKNAFSRSYNSRIFFIKYSFSISSF